MTYSSPILRGDIRHNQPPMSFNAGKKHQKIPSKRSLKKHREEIELFKKKNLEGTMLAIIF